MENTDVTGDRPYFDEASKDWDQNPLVLELAEAAASNLLLNLNLDENLVVMEYGCGTDLIAENIAPKVKHLYGWDNSAGMLSAFNSKLQGKPSLRITTEHADLVANNFNERKFDLIYSSMALHHVEDTKSLLQKFKDLLNPGGCLALIDLDTEDGSFHGDIPGVYHNGFERVEIESQLTNAGFSYIEKLTAYKFVKEDDEGLPNEYSLFLITGHVAP